MWASAQALVNYGEAVGTMIVAGALADWSLSDAQRRRLADGAARLRTFVADIGQRRLVGAFCHPQLQRNFLAAVFLCESLLVCLLARHLDYRGTEATARDVLIGELLLFVVPLGVAALALLKTGPRLIRLMLGRGNLPACFAKCLVAALVANVLGFAALELMNETYFAFGPRAELDWWDARLTIYAAEYAVSGMIVSAMMIANLLLVVLAAASLVLMLMGSLLLEADLFARLIARYPKGSLLGSSIAVAGLAIVLKDWM